MPASTERSVLFFRIYLEVTLPLYAAVVEELCASPHLPFQLATVLEDIGQEFIRLGALVNAALDRLGLLEHEVDADLTVEAQIDTVMSSLATSEPFMSAGCGHSGSILTDATLQRALRIALIMTHDLPIAGGP